MTESESHFSEVDTDEADKICVEIYILNTDTLQGEDDRILSAIPPLYVQKYEKARVESVKKQELGAGYLLSRVLGVTRDEQLAFGEHGKPYLNREYMENISKSSNMFDGKDADILPEFSLSHADKYVVLAVSSKPIGVDIERINRITEPVLKRVLPEGCFEKLKQGVDFSEPEESSVESTGETGKKLVYARAWTSVEAILKADGSGFFTDPREDDKFMDGWYIESFTYKDEFMISCASGVPFKLIQKGL